MVARSVRQPTAAMTRKARCRLYGTAFMADCSRKKRHGRERVGASRAGRVPIPVGELPAYDLRLFAWHVKVMTLTRATAGESRANGPGSARALCRWHAPGSGLDVRNWAFSEFRRPAWLIAVRAARHT